MTPPQVIATKGALADTATLSFEPQISGSNALGQLCPNASVPSASGAKAAVGADGVPVCASPTFYDNRERACIGACKSGM